MKSRFPLLACLASLIVVCGAYLYFNLKQNAVAVPGSTGQVTSVVFEEKLKWIKPGNPDDYIGGNTHVMTFRTASDHRIELHVAEGAVNTTTIAPEEEWAKLISKNSSVLILNSPDERYTHSSGLNGVICQGCEIPELEKSISIGRTSFVPCKGALSKNMNIHFVAQAVVINMGDRVTPADVDDMLVKDYKEISRQWQTNLGSAIESFFQNNNSNNVYATRSPDIWIIPSVGTRIGGLSKETFYDSFFTHLEKSALDPHYQEWPEKIILHVYRDDIEWTGDFILAVIADRLIDFYVSMETKSGLYQDDLNAFYQLIGVLTCLFVVVIVMEKKKMPVFLTIRRGDLWLSVLGSVLLSFGTIELVHRVLPIAFLKQVNNPFEIIVGVVCVPLSLFVLNAREIVGRKLDG